jgi:peptidoglycan-associated lipoprotein
MGVLAIAGMLATGCSWFGNTRRSLGERLGRIFRPKPTVFLPEPIQDYRVPPLDTEGWGDEGEIGRMEIVGSGPSDPSGSIPYGSRPGYQWEIDGSAAPVAESRLLTVRFGYDRHDLTPEARQILDENAAYLLANRNVRVLIEGHCDERGTIEYNLSLGQRRADAVREYLISKGVPPQRLEAISHGEWRPIDPGHGETAWAKNRRAQFAAY